MVQNNNHQITFYHFSCYVVKRAEAYMCLFSFLLSMSAFCGARASSVVAPHMAKEIATAPNNLELGDYPDPEEIKVGGKLIIV